MIVDLKHNIPPVVFDLLEKVTDPEIPVLSIIDLGVVLSLIHI